MTLITVEKVVVIDALNIKNQNIFLGELSGKGMGLIK